MKTIIFLLIGFAVGVLFHSFLLPKLKILWARIKAFFTKEKKNVDEKLQELDTKFKDKI